MKTILALALAAAAVFAAPADAATYLFQLTGPTTAMFQLDSSPTPTNVSGKGFFAVSPVAGTYNGVAGTGTISFFNDAPADGIAGGLEIDVPVGGDSIFRRGGDVLYTGSLNMPTFKLGTFQLLDGANGKVQTLTISAVGAVPEPATWGMMLVGFGLVGGAARARSRRISPAA